MRDLLHTTYMIDAKDIGFVLDGLMLLRAQGGVPGAEEAIRGVRRWIEIYYAWLAGSAHAKLELNDTNNHGVGAHAMCACVRACVQECVCVCVA